MEQGFFDGMNNLTSGLSGMFAQGAYILAAMMCLALGFALSDTWLRWKRRGVTVDGTVAGARHHGKFYYPVYNYKFPDSDTLQEATADSGTTDASSIETGREVKLMVLRDTPDTAHETGGFPWHLVGLALVACGFWSFYHAVTAYPVGEMTGLMVVLLVMYFLNKSRRVFGTGRQRKTIAAYRQMQWNIMSEQPVEDLRSNPDMARRLDTAKNMQGLLGTVFSVVGAGLLAYCLYLSADVLTLHTDGISAKGKVTELSKEYVSGRLSGYQYFPVVRFQDKDGHDVTFKDHEGSGSPAYEEGDEVDVIYLAKDATGTATIDHGFNDWTMPILFCFFGVLFLGKGISMLPRQRDESR